MKYLKWLSLVSAFFLLGCANQGSSTYSFAYPPLAIPLQPSFQQSVQIARLNQLLARKGKDISNSVRAKMFAERGRLLDSLGMADLARLDYESSVLINPQQSEMFNALGMYAIQISDFDSAFDAFDSSLELDPNNEYAERNRAIALYYADRIPLALQDMQSNFDKDPSDPYRALWLYYIQRETDVQKATADLEQSYQNKGEQWGWELVGMALGHLDQNDVLESVTMETQNNVELAQNLTELYFYLAKEYQYKGDYPNAIALYKLAISMNVYYFAEHHYAFLELTRIFKAIQAEQEAQEQNSQAPEVVKPDEKEESKNPPSQVYRMPKLSA